MRLTVVRAMVGGLVSVLIILQLIHLSMISWLENKATSNGNGRRSAGSGSLPGKHKHSSRDRTKSQHLEAKLDTTGSYKIYHSYMKAAAAVDRKSHDTLPSDVTLVTQCSVNNLYHLVDLVVRWRGPISVAVFSFSPNTSTLNNVLFTLRECFPAVKANVTFHLVQPITEITDALDGAGAHSFTKFPCETILTSLKDRTLQSATSQIQNYSQRVLYPNNVLRNVARSGAVSRYVFVIDIDIVPSAFLRTQFLHLSRSSIILQEETEYSKRTAFVVPAFEIQEGQDIPLTKERLLLDKARYGHIRPFYIEDCPHCQNHTDYHRWEKSRGTPGDVNIAYTVEWKPLWEPFYIGHRDVPLYDERFKQYGFNRISQVCEMHVAGYNFAVLDTSFLIHRGFKEKARYHAKKLQENQRNKELFLHFQEELKVKYPDSSKRCQT